MTGGKNGLSVLACGPELVPTTTSCPSFKSSATTAVFAPSVVPIFTSTGRTYSPTFSQTVPTGCFEPCCFFLSSDGGSAGLCERASGDICVSEDGDQRNAALGTSNTSDSLRTTK